MDTETGKDSDNPILTGPFWPVFFRYASPVYPVNQPNSSCSFSPGSGARMKDSPTRNP